MSKGYSWVNESTSVGELCPPYLSDVESCQTVHRRVYDNRGDVGTQHKETTIVPMSPSVLEVYRTRRSHNSSTERTVSDNIHA